MKKVLRNEDGEFLGFDDCDDTNMSRADYARMARIEDGDYDDEEDEC